MFFLGGDVFPLLKANVKLLRSSPKNVVKFWAQNTPHILAFINALIRRQVYSRQKLLDVWTKDKFCRFFYRTSNNEIITNRFVCRFQILCKSIKISWLSQRLIMLLNGLQLMIDEIAHFRLLTTNNNNNTLSLYNNSNMIELEPFE